MLDQDTDFTLNLRKLIVSGRKFEFDKAEVTQSSDYGSVLSMLETGYIKRYFITSDGLQGIQSIMGPGDIFPLTLVFRALFSQNIYEGPETYYYEAMSPCTVHSISAETLKSAVKNDNSLYRALLFESGRRFHSNIHHLENLSLHDSYHRVAHQLAYFAEKFGKKTSRGIEVELPITHQDIAGLLSVTRETVTISISKMRRQGLIKNTRTILIPNIERLKTKAHS